MLSYGDLNQDLVLNSNGNIYLVFNGKQISMLDSNGNPNIKIKNLVKSGVPDSQSDNGIYCDNNNVYIKTDTKTINLTQQINDTQLPAGSIVKFKGSTDNIPEGWFYYGNSEINGVIYIINIDNAGTYELIEVTLSWNPSQSNTTFKTFSQPVLQKISNGNVPILIEYSSSNTSVATVDGSGSITLKGVGTTDITAKTYANLQHTASQSVFSLTVRKDDLSASFTQNSREITVGESFVPSIVFRVNNQIYNESVGEYYLTTDNSNIAQISGLSVIGKTAGTANIKVNVRENEWHNAYTSQNLELTVISNNVPVSTVSIAPSVFTVNSGGTYQLAATISPNNATDKSITWEIVQGNATISSSGLLTAGEVSQNTTVIVKAIASNGIYGTSTGTITAQVEPGPTPPDYPTIDYTNKFSELITAFNNTTPVNGAITTNGAVYNYLKSYYDEAYDQWTDSSSFLFKASTYPEIEGYTNIEGVRRTNKQSYELAYDAMTSWLMAMCLSELIPTSGSTSNNQTILFSTAWNYKGNGNSIPLYNDYDIHCDPMIARLAAAAVYAMVHDTDTVKNSIPSVRATLGGNTINGSSWDDLGYFNGTDNDNAYKPMTNTGYIVNTYSFLSGSFGPFLSDTPSNWPFNQPSSQYYGSGNTDAWKDYNYRVDVAIDQIISQNYIPYTSVNGQYTFKTPTTAAEKEINQRLVEAGAIPWSYDFNYFGKKRVKFDKAVYYTYDAIANDYNKNISLLRFKETSDTITNTNNVYDVAGPFSSLQNLMFTGGSTSTYSFNTGSETVSQSATVYTKTSYMTFLHTIMAIADNCRLPSHSNYRRKRPVGGAGSSILRTTYQQDPRSGFECGSLIALTSGEDGGVSAMTKISQCDWPGDDKGKAYPSGHSAQVWTLAMYLGQMNPINLETYMQGAYRFSVNRTIGKFHWNSDCIYGRLYGTMILPIINAMSGLSSMYNSLKTAINGGSSEGTITISITNNSSETMDIDKHCRFVLNNNGTVVRNNLVASDSGNLEISPGQTKSFTVDLSRSQGFEYLNLPFASQQLINGTYPGNVMLYAKDSSNGYSDGDKYSIYANTNDTFAYGTYNITYGTSGSSSTGPINVNITNNTGSSVTLGRSNSTWISFRLQWSGTSSEILNAEMGPTITLASENTTIANNSTRSFSNIVLDSNALAYVSANRTFASSNELTAFSNQYNISPVLSSNISIPDANNDGSTRTISVASISSSETFRGGATYNIVLGSGTSTISGGSSGGTGSSVVVDYGSNPNPPNPNPTNDITFNLTVVNNSGYQAKLNGEMYFYLEGAYQNGDYTDYYDSGKGKSNGGIILPGASDKVDAGGYIRENLITIANGSSRTFEITLPAEKVTTYSNRVARRSLLGNKTTNVTFYSYGKYDVISNPPGSASHIAGVFIAGFLDGNENGVALENGSSHTVTLTGVSTSYMNGNVDLSNY